MKFFRELWGKKDDGTELPETAMTLLRTQAETWTSLEPIENTPPASWEATAQSTLPAWWAQRRAAAKPSVTEHNVSLMMFYWFLFLSKWEIIRVIHQQQSVIKGLIITEHASIVRSQSWKTTMLLRNQETPYALSKQGRRWAQRWHWSPDVIRAICRLCWIVDNCESREVRKCEVLLDTWVRRWAPEGSQWWARTVSHRGLLSPWATVRCSREPGLRSS